MKSAQQQNEKHYGGRYKPDFVEGDHFSRTAVTGGLQLPTQELFAARRSGASRSLLSYLALLRTGFTMPARSPGTAVGSYPTFSPLPNPKPTGGRPGFGGMFSVALSVGFLLLGVTQRPALWSPDFPRTERFSPRSPPPPGVIIDAKPFFYKKPLYRLQIF